MTKLVAIAALFMSLATLPKESGAQEATNRTTITPFIGLLGGTPVIGGAELNWGGPVRNFFLAGGAPGTGVAAIGRLFPFCKTESKICPAVGFAGGAIYAEGNIGPGAFVVADVAIPFSGPPDKAAPALRFGMKLLLPAAYPLLTIGVSTPLPSR